MAEGVSYSGEMLDITAPEHPVQVDVRADGTILWVHVDGRTVLRICRMPGLEVKDARFDVEGQDELLTKIMRTDLAKLEQGFKDVIGPLPNYKRAMAFEYINALIIRLKYEEHKVHELSGELADHRVANRVLRPTADIPAVPAPEAEHGS